ncbi:MAG: PDZ domain-containing protein [Acidimicrobiales bacterium]
MAAWEWISSWRPKRRRPPAEGRPWVHPSELPSFENLSTTATVPHVRTPRLIAAVMAVLLLVGGIVLLVNRGTGTPANDLPAHLATTLNDLPASARAAAAHTVELTITIPGHVNVINVAALVLPHDLAVTTLAIPVNAEITGTSATKSNFKATLKGRDDVMGFSIVHLGVNIAPLALDVMPASAAVVAVAPVVTGLASKPEYDWTMTTLGDPSNDAHGVVRYLATKSNTSLNKFVDAIAIDAKGHVVAVLSSTHFWYPAQFVAQIANVAATGYGCHAELGVQGKNEQGGGVLITKVIPYGPAAHAGLKAGEVLTTWNGTELDSWNQLVSTLYLTPAYTKATISYAESTTVHHLIVTLGCPSKLVP